MRLKPQEIEFIVLALEPFLQNKIVELRLYGSRMQDNMKGGDIDLLLITEDEKFANHLRSNKHFLLAAIKKNLGDQKIDLTIAARSNLTQDDFLKMIFPKSGLLKSWTSSY